MMFEKLDKLVDPNNAWVRTAGWVLLAFFVADYGQGNLVGAVVLLGVGMLSLTERYGRRLETLEAEITALRTQLAAALLPTRDGAPSER